jgi:hypothetical protein
MMAAQTAITCVHGQARIASLAFCDMTAGRADQGWRETATIEKQQHLPIRADMLRDGSHKWVAQSFGGSGTVQIDESHGRRPGTTGALGQHELREITVAAMSQ